MILCCVCYGQKMKNKKVIKKNADTITSHAAEHAAEHAADHTDVA